jgi:cyclophilin family peptidyl-prolyl cis-trans isomerase
MLFIIILSILLTLISSNYIEAIVTSKVQCETTKGSFTLEIYREWSPLGADRFIELIKDDFFTNISLFRCVKGFLTQFGITEDKTKKHWNNEKIQDDPNLHIPIRKGYLSFAGSGDNSRSTQMFIAFEDLDFLGKSPWETPFGKIIDGYSTLDKFYKGYGDIPPIGKGPDQQKIHNRGNAYIKIEFPKIDFITSCKVIEEYGNINQINIELNNNNNNNNNNKDIENEFHQEDNENQINNNNINNLEIEQQLNVEKENAKDELKFFIKDLNKNEKINNENVLKEDIDNEFQSIEDDEHKKITTFDPKNLRFDLHKRKEIGRNTEENNNIIDNNVNNHNENIRTVVNFHKSNIDEHEHITQNEVKYKTIKDKEYKDKANLIIEKLKLRKNSTIAAPIYLKKYKDKKHNDEFNLRGGNRSMTKQKQSQLIIAALLVMFIAVIGLIYFHNSKYDLMNFPLIRKMM